MTTLSVSHITETEKGTFHFPREKSEYFRKYLILFFITCCGATRTGCNACRSVTSNQVDVAMSMMTFKRCSFHLPDVFLICITILLNSGESTDFIAKD